LAHLTAGTLARKCRMVPDRRGTERTAMELEAESVSYQSSGDDEPQAG